MVVVGRGGAGGGGRGSRGTGGDCGGGAGGCCWLVLIDCLFGLLLNERLSI